MAKILNPHIYKRVKRKFGLGFGAKLLVLSIAGIIFYQKTQGIPNPDDDNPGPIKEAIYDDNIRTVQLTRTGLSNSYPIIQLNTTDQLSLAFDLVGTTSGKNYQFTVVHCEADWTKSSMLQSDYISGMFQDYINAYSFSSGTYVRYAHYIVAFPSQNMNVKISGNYVMKVYLDDPDKPVIVRRFYVYENLVRVGGTAVRATYSRYRETDHEINFTINTRGLSVIDPFASIKTVVKQNWRWDNEITDLKPTYVRDQSLIYDYQEGNLFDAGNEFRAFDTRDLRYKGGGGEEFYLRFNLSCLIIS